MPAPMPDTAARPLALFDHRPFFERALIHGLLHGLIDEARLDSMATEAPKGMVQIARYFGSEFLRPELEKARDRLINLISLNLEQESAGDLGRAAAMLREHSLLSRSKRGSDMLKGLIAMPQSTHFGLHDQLSDRAEQTAQLAKWSLRSFAQYQAEWRQRNQVVELIEAALWLAQRLGMDTEDVQDSHCDAEQVIRTALLSLATGQQRLPDWVAFERMVAGLRKQKAGASEAVQLAMPAALPAELRAAVAAVHQSLLSDLPTVLDSSRPIRKLFTQTPAFIGRYFWVESALSEVDAHERTSSAAWDKATGGHSDDGSLLTLFLCIAVGSSPKTLLTAKSAAALVRKARKTGLQTELVPRYIADHAPQQQQRDYLTLWQDFLDDAQDSLLSDHAHSLPDALALLRRHCHVADG